MMFRAQVIINTLLRHIICTELILICLGIAKNLKMCYNFSKSTLMY